MIDMNRWTVIKRWLSKCRDKIIELAGRARYKVAAPKETITVTLGMVESTSNERYPVELRGQYLAEHFHAKGNKRITETLYHVGYKRYLVHTRTLYRTKGLRTEFDLREIDEADLQEGHRYATLGRLRLPVTVGEALRI